MIVAGANVHDTKLLEATLEAIVVERPEPTEESPQNLCLDKAYDNPLDIGLFQHMDIRGTSAGSGKRSWISGVRKSIPPDVG